MGVIGTVTEMLKASTQSPNRGTGRAESAGAYWCDDCDVRVRDVDVTGDPPPSCPDCGDEMRFERSAATTGCAC
ncbi:MAG: hypothetical protein ABEJ70_04680 [Halobacteriaceae archaeon]